MALNIRINIKNRYTLTPLSDDFSLITFESVLVDDSTIKIGVKISTEEHPYMPNVYNLAFGPITKDFQIDDQCRLKHMDHSKVFSTIVFVGLTFLTHNRGKYLGIDGSNTARAYMYYRCIQNNFEYLNSLFDISGVNYYLRIFRDGSDDYDVKDLMVTPHPITPGERVRAQKLYNYFIFKSK